jgi:hypothetical protein
MEILFNIILQVIKKIVTYLGITIALILIIYTLYAIPAMLSLPAGIRPGIEELTIEEAIDALDRKDLESVDLIEEARILVGRRMAYCRRNSYESYTKAFRRGYGFCQQQAFALAAILEGLDFDAVPVQSMQTRFPEANIGGHAWVRVKLNGEYLFIDPIFYNAEKHEITFTPLSEVTEFGSFFRILSGWGSATINAHRYYTSGRD